LAHNKQGLAQLVCLIPYEAVLSTDRDGRRFHVVQKSLSSDMVSMPNESLHSWGVIKFHKVV